MSVARCMYSISGNLQYNQLIIYFLFSIQPLAMSRLIFVAIIFALAIQSFECRISCGDYIQRTNTMHQHLQQHITYRFCRKNEVSFDF